MKNVIIVSVVISTLAASVVLVALLAVGMIEALGG